MVRIPVERALTLFAAKKTEAAKRIRVRPEADAEKQGPSQGGR